MPRKEQYPDLGFHRWFAKARYLGGSSKFSEGWAGFLFFTTEAIGLGKKRQAGPQETVIPMEMVASIEITGRQVAKSKVGPVLVFGLAGLAARGSTNETTVVVRTNDAETVYYSIPDQSPETVRAVLTPLLKHVGVSFYDEVAAPASATAPDLSDQLRKLAALRDDGLLTDEEFEVQKSRLLNS